jgi:hypothetical protein
MGGMGGEWGGDTIGGGWGGVEWGGTIVKTYAVPGKKFLVDTLLKQQYGKAGIHNNHYASTGRKR